MCVQETLAAHAASGTVGQYSDLTLQSVAAFDEDEIPLEVIEGTPPTHPITPYLPLH